MWSCGQEFITPDTPKPNGRASFVASHGLRRNQFGADGRLRPRRSGSRYDQSACTEVGNVTGGIVADIGAAGWKDFGAMNSSHHLPAARAHAAVHEESVETDTFVAQRITLVDADHGGREPCYVFGGGERRPGQRV